MSSGYGNLGLQEVAVGAATRTGPVEVALVELVVIYVALAPHGAADNFFPARYPDPGVVLGENRRPLNITHGPEFADGGLVRAAPNPSQLGDRAQTAEQVS